MCAERGPTRLPPGKSATSRCAHRAARGREQLRIKAKIRMCSPSYPAPGLKKIKVSLLGSEGGEMRRVSWCMVSITFYFDPTKLRVGLQHYCS